MSVLHMITNVSIASVFVKDVDASRDFYVDVLGFLPYEELSAKGVDFIQPPAERPYGVEAIARDNSGNWMVLVEPRAFTASDFG